MTNETDLSPELLPGTIETTSPPLVARDPLYERMAEMALPPEATNPAVLLRDHAAHPWAFEVAKRFASVLEQGAMLPKSYIDGRDRSEARAAATVAIMHGAKIGLDPLGAVQGLAVVNGMPKLWGDALPAVVMPHGVRLQEDLPEEWTKEAVAVCTVVRPGHEPVTRRFSYADAERAKLLDKPTWKSYPMRMLQMRARGFALRDACPDLLAGFGIAEEAMDAEPERYEARRLEPLPRHGEGAREVDPIDVEVAKLRETGGAPATAAATNPRAEPHEIGDEVGPGQTEPEPEAAPPQVEEHSQLGGDIVGRLVEAGMPLDLAKRVTVDERVAETGSVHTTKKARPRKGAPGDVWMCEHDCTAHVLVQAGDEQTREWIKLDLSPPQPAQDATEEAVEFYDEQAKAREAEAAEEPLLDPQELDPDVPGHIDESWLPDLPEGPWTDAHAYENPDDDAGEADVWISTRPGRTKGVAYALADGTWKPSGAAGEWARAWLARNWRGTEADLNQAVGGDWRSCGLDELYDAALGMGLDALGADEQGGDE